MDSIDTPIVDDEADVKHCLAEAQAALETLRSLQTDHRQSSI